MGSVGCSIQGQLLPSHLGRPEAAVRGRHQQVRREAEAVRTHRAHLLECVRGLDVPAREARPRGACVGWPAVPGCRVGVVCPTVDGVHERERIGFYTMTEHTAADARTAREVTRLGLEIVVVPAHHSQSAAGALPITDRVAWPCPCAARIRLHSKDVDRITVLSERGVDHAGDSSWPRPEGRSTARDCS